MAKLRKRIKKVLKHRSKKSYRYSYLKYLKRAKVMRKTVLAESTHGDTFDGSIAAIVLSMVKNDDFSDYKLYVGVEETKVKQYSSIYNYPNLTFVPYLSDEYCKLLASAEYLLNDTSFYDMFNKQSFQKYYNIWHGTPLKKMGKDNGDVLHMGNVQNNFYNADYLVVSNEITKDILANGYNLNNVMHGKVLVAPSPRNSVLKLASDMDIPEDHFYNDLMKYTKTKHNYMYMPTWRGTNSLAASFDDSILKKHLMEIDSKLNDDETLVVKLHPFEAEISELDYSLFNHIKPYNDDINDEYGLYGVLAGTDALVTDYSSVMYDYLDLKKPIILFDYDKKRYYAERDCYDDIADYPFEHAKTGIEVGELLHQLESKDHISQVYYPEDFVSDYVGHDVSDGADLLVEYLFNQKEFNSDNERFNKFETYTLSNGKENVIISAGALWKNGVTTALLNTLDTVDTSKRNYIICFKRRRLKAEDKYQLYNLPENVTFYAVAGAAMGSVFEQYLVRRYQKNEWLNWGMSTINQFYRREFKRAFGALRPSDYISYTGFEREVAGIVTSLKDTNVKTTMYIHTDMFEERKVRGKAVNWKMLTKAYKNCTNIVVVSKKLIPDLIKHFPSFKDRIKVVDNFLRPDKIRKEANRSIFSTLIEAPVVYAHNNIIRNEILHSLGGLQMTLNKPNPKKLVSNTLPHYFNYLYEKHDDSHKVIPFEHVYEHRQEFSDAVTNDLASNMRDSAPILNTEFDIKDMNYIYGLTKMRLLDDLYNPEIKVFINVGRMVEQKGHERLINSFAKVHKVYPNTRLVIVAPHGNLKKKTKKWIKESGCQKDIYLLGGMASPYALMRMSDAMIFTSYYEGLGLVAYEALATGLDLLTVDLPETIEYLDDTNAKIVPNDDDAITDGWMEYMKQGIPNKTEFDFEGHDKASVQQFENIFE